MIVLSTSKMTFFDILLNKNLNVKFLFSVISQLFSTTHMDHLTLKCELAIKYFQNVSFILTKNPIFT